MPVILTTCDQSTVEWMYYAKVSVLKFLYICEIITNLGKKRVYQYYFEFLKNFAVPKVMFCSKCRNVDRKKCFEGVDSKVLRLKRWHLQKTDLEVQDIHMYHACSHLQTRRSCVSRQSRDADVSCLDHEIV